MLNDKQVKAIGYMIQGLKQKEVAEKAGVAVRTLRNWLSNDEFMEEYQKQQNILFQALAGEAFNTLADLMRNSSSDTVRLNAAKDILSRAGYDATAKSKTEISTPENIVINIEE